MLTVIVTSTSFFDFSFLKLEFLVLRIIVRRWKILTETDDFVTGMKIVKEADGSFTYNRIKLASRGTNTDKYLLYPIKQSEVAKMLKHTGADWQNPGW